MLWHGRGTSRAMSIPEPVVGVADHSIDGDSRSWYRHRRTRKVDT